MGLEINPDVQAHVDRILPEVRVQMMREEFNGRIRDLVFDVVFADAQIKIDFEGADIRKTTMCGEVVKGILANLGEEHGDIRLMEQDQEEENDITMMAIGDVDFPEFMWPVVREILAKSQQNFEYLTDPERGKTRCGYDYAARGYRPARKIVLENWNRYYAFSDRAHPVEKKVPDPAAEGGIRTETVDENLMEVLERNSTITPGGMHAITILNITLNKLAEKKGLKKRYIYPDNSFGTWKSIMKTVTTETPGKFEQIRTEQKDRLQLTPEKVHQFYDTHDIDGRDDTWYITPVGNPSGTAMTGEQLTATCEAILERNPAASIILDVVYLRTMEIDAAKRLINGVMSNPKIMDRVIFIESLSKTHGVPGLRVGMFFSANKELYEATQNADMTLFAGHGHQLSALMMAFLDDPDGRYEEAFKELHRFWGRERKGLFEFLIKSGKYKHLFEEDQPQVEQGQLDEPLGLYLDLRMREGVTAMQIYKETGCIGVEHPMNTEDDKAKGNNKYMRFSVGKITKPTYSKTAEAEG
jgi:hypothetical protein